jgi:hypothetical protein
MHEKRKINRRFLSYFIRVFDSDTRQQIGNLADITPQGILLISLHSIPKGQIIRLRLEVTPEVSDKPFLEFSAQSKWCQPDIDPKLYNVGFKLLNLTPEDAVIIKKINDSFGFRENRPGG